MSEKIIYDLTPMTRDADSQRRWVIKGFDLPKRGLVIFSIAFIPGIFISAMLWRFFDSYALVALALVEGIAFWAFEGRSRQGMKLRNYQTYYDKSRSKTGQFFICGRPIDVGPSDITYVRILAAPSTKKTKTTNDLFGIETPDRIVIDDADREWLTPKVRDVNHIEPVTIAKDPTPTPEPAPAPKYALSEGDLW